eukprot:CAMPEP_0177315740 /NCGR_PEP_ID=MMETSP0368-20130122/12618_1 /TAXON_ID=447022 ORGANISM="Scrippsiella hangoei-like, Strain SHHI-4" /NCGR_SAMPLE_ID=MMETSP0368 /ASSEMBLY_ACC=CAM_ASM_000363 /LENGTH=40 /DNA_ID= /DNA_START= /DNA_END= /DNA_ORIENTATION=
MSIAMVKFENAACSGRSQWVEYSRGVCAVPTPPGPYQTML